MEQAEQVTRKIGTRIRATRHAKNMTLADVSDATGLSSAFLSRLERGAVSTSIANLIRITTALCTSLQMLFEDDARTPQAGRYLLVRRGDRETRAMVTAAGYLYDRVSGDFGSQHLAAFDLEFPVGMKTRMPFVAHEGEEMLFVLAGQIELRVDSERVILEQGDCLHLNSEYPHMCRNPGKTPARMLMVVSPARPKHNQFAWWSPPKPIRVRPTESELHMRLGQGTNRKSRRISKGGTA